MKNFILFLVFIALVFLMAIPLHSQTWNYINRDSIGGAVIGSPEWISNNEFVTYTKWKFDSANVQKYTKGIFTNLITEDNWNGNIKEIIPKNKRYF